MSGRAVVLIAAIFALAGPPPAPVASAAKIRTCRNAVLHNRTGGQAYKLAGHAWVYAPNGFDKWRGWKCVAPETSAPVTS